MKAEEQFTKEQLDAIAIVDKLYSLQKDIDYAWAIFCQKPIFLCKLKRTEFNFNHALPHIFVSFVEAIERGDLIWKEEVMTKDGIIVTN